MLNTRDVGKAYPILLDWLRYSCAFLLYMYGISKLAHLQFNLTSQLATRPAGSLTGYELTWFYYGYSRVYACILGMTQVAGATLLLFRRTTLIAAIILLPVIANILLINMFILVNDYGPYVISALICASMVAILWQQRAGLVSLLWTAQSAEPERSKRLHRWIRIAVVLAVGGITISVMVLQHYLVKR
jgi:hypothetical protein